MRNVEAFLMAVSFLTAVPVGKIGAEAKIGRSIAYFPLVGLMIGAVLIFIDLGARSFLPDEIRNAFLVLALVAITNGFHLDGLADVADGIGGGETSDDALEIMKESRIGAFGAAAIFFDLLLKYVLLNRLSGGIRLGVLAAFPTLSRWAMSVSVATQRSPRGEEGLAGWLRARATRTDSAAATALALAVIAVALGGKAIAVFAVASLTASGIILYFRHRLGGMTGDCHGALNEVVEIAVLLTAAVIG